MRAQVLMSMLACLAGPALAQTAPADPPASENGRYSMTPAPGGFLRMDTRTGATSLCTVENGAARCVVAAEERSALQQEIDRLSQQNEALTSRGGKSGGLPTAEDFGRAMDYAEQFMRRMMRIMRDEDPGRKT